MEIEPSTGIYAEERNAREGSLVRDPEIRFGLKVHHRPLVRDPEIRFGLKVHHRPVTEIRV